MDRAVDWLFSHADMPMDEEPIATTTGSNVHNSGQELMDTYPANYELKAFISHKGTSVSCGHYVAHVKQSDGRWILFNDNKVVHVPDTEMLKATGEGYLYFYSRNQ
jgi:ubiquitin carboxyl-terminal hydrolase 5/13